MTGHVNQILDAALAFTQAGCSVVPAAADGSKAPAGKWQRWQAERPSAAQVTQWLSNGHYDGFGVICGAVSGGLEMLELEGRAVAAGVHIAYRDALADHGLGDLWRRIATGYTETTPSGGLHILYRVNGTARPNTKLARRPATAAELAGKPGEKIKVLIETRGEGGFTITAPSACRTHPTGKAWRPGSGSPATIATISEEERDALHAVASLLDQSPVQQVQLPRSAADGQSGDRPGDDYAARASWQDILAPHGWRCVSALGPGAHGWRRPGKDTPGISATTRETGGLYVFSTSTPFETETPYSKFGAYAVLSHGGDHAAAARQLRREGYGTPAERDDDGISDLIAGSPAVTPAARVVATKEEERKPAVSAVPSADPAMYTGILGDIVDAAAPTTEADPVGIYASLLAGAGVIMNSTPYVRVGNTRHPLLIWPLLLGRTGSGRKGEATSTAEIFLRNAAPEAQALMVSGLSSGEGLIERIRDPDEESQEGRFRQPGGTEDKRLLVLETEFASVLARSRREGSTLAAVQRQAWEGRALSVLNRKQLKASASHIAIIGHITPQEFRLRLAEADMTGGTYNRYLPLFVERSRRLPIPEGIADHLVTDLSARLRSAIRNATRSGPLQLGPEATQLWSGELYDELTAGDDEDLAEAEFTRRAAPYCLRIAGLFAVLDDRRLISKDDLAAAAALIRYSIASAKYVLDRRLRDPRLDRIRRAIDSAGQTGLTRTEVSALFSRNLAKADLDQLLTELINHDGYEESLTHGRGRPAQTYRRVVSSSFVSKEAQ